MREAGEGGYVHCGVTTAERGAWSARNPAEALHRAFAKAALVLLVLALTSPKSGKAAPAGQSDAAPRRIVSLAPSTTEILFELGLGDRIVGVTRYCDYPAAVESIAKVGGLLDPNFEEIVALQPDLTILLASSLDAKRELEKMRLRTLTVPHRSVGDVQTAIRLIGDACGGNDRANLLLKRLWSRSEAVRDAVRNRPRPKVLICIGRDTESGQLDGVYVAGRYGFYDQIIEAAGGVNACFNGPVAHPQLSAESVIDLNPDVVVDLVSFIKPGGRTAGEIEDQWKQIPILAAVRSNRVHVVAGNYALRPGPRYVEFLEELAQLLHPEAFHWAEAND